MTTTDLKIVDWTNHVHEKMIDDYLFWSKTKLTDEQKVLFKNVAIQFQLSPFKREIYAIPYERNVKDAKGNRSKQMDMNIVTGYQVYIDRAMVSWMLDGWNVEILRGQDNKLIWAKITIYRKDFKYPFTWEVSVAEFMKKKSDGTPMGTRAVMPEFMIKKIAMGQWFRLAFPNELSGMPYLPEEITDTKEGVIVPEKPEAKQLINKAIEKLDAKIAENKEKEEQPVEFKEEASKDTDYVDSALPKASTEERAVYFRKIIDDETRAVFDRQEKPTRQIVMDIVNAIVSDHFMQKWTEDMQTLKDVTMAFYKEHEITE